MSLLVRVARDPSGGGGGYGPSVLRRGLGQQRVDRHLVLDLHVGVTAGPSDGGGDAAGDLHGAGQGVGVADGLDDVGRFHLDAGDRQPLVGVGEPGVGDHPHVADLDRLGPGGAQLLDGVEDDRGVDLVVGVGDRQHDTGPRGRDGAGEDAERVEPLAGRALGLGLVGGLALEQVERGLQPTDLVGELLTVLVGVGEDAHQLVLAQVLEALERSLVHLGDDREAQAAGQQHGEHVGPGRAWRPGADQSLPGPLGGVGRTLAAGGAVPGIRVGGLVVAGAQPLEEERLDAGRGRGRALNRLLGVARGAGHASKRWRRIAATLEKIRTPSTTTTPVDSWLPTPSLSPRNTMNAATTTLDRNETTKTLSSKMPSRIARTAPKTASRAAMTAIGRYGWSHTGTAGCRATAWPPQYPRSGRTGWSDPPRPARSGRRRRRCRRGCRRCCAAWTGRCR